MTDQTLKAEFSRGVEGCLDSLFGLALRLTRNPADADDLVAEAVAKAWSSFQTLEDRNRFGPWLFRILHNCFVSDYRRRSSRPEAYIHERTGGDEGEDDDLTYLLIQQSNDFLSWWGNPEREFFNGLLGEDIVAAMETLPEAFRITITLVNGEGLSYEEAAEVLGVPLGTIHSRMKRGRTLLQKALWEHAKAAGLISEDHAQRCPQ